MIVLFHYEFHAESWVYLMAAEITSSPERSVTKVMQQLNRLQFTGTTSVVPVVGRRIGAARGLPLRKYRCLNPARTPMDVGACVSDTELAKLKPHLRQSK
jgi:hypothetical protein